MNYFEYTEARITGKHYQPEPEIEMLEFTGDEAIDVEEHGMTVADVREFIKHMHAHNEAHRNKTNGSVVALKDRNAA